METRDSRNEDDDLFFDALDDFPFFDCTTENQPDPSTSQPVNISPFEPSLDSPSPAQSLRWRSFHSTVHSNESKDDSAVHSPVSSDESTDIAKTSFKRRRVYRNEDISEESGMCEESSKLNRRETSFESAPTGVQERESGDSTLTAASDKSPAGDSVDSAAAASVDSASAATGDSTNFLVLIAELVIKAIGFEFNLFITFITLPIKFMHQSLMFVVDPFRKMRLWMWVLSKVCNLASGFITPSLKRWLEENKSMWKVGLKCGWGLLWSMYVGVILFGLLLSSLVSSGLMMRYLVQEPFRMEEVINFDYTKESPVAYVPIVSCAGVDCGGDCEDNVDIGGSIGSRVIPKNHRLQLFVSLVLPESGHNRNLGIFQIRVEFLSANGKILVSSRHPCMLHFKSEPLRLLLTFLKIAPLITGYTSETQSVIVRMGGFREGDISTSCLRVKLEQRAEFYPGAGIPEIYDASIVLESELPFLRRILWYWRKTLFVWLSFTSFTMQFLFTLLCCRPCIIPRRRTRDAGVVHGRPIRTNRPVQS